MEIKQEHSLKSLNQHPLFKVASVDCHVAFGYQIVLPSMNQIQVHH